MFSEHDLGVKKSTLSFQAIGIGGAMVGLSSGVFNLTEALLLVIAVAETIDAGFDYYAQEVE